MSDTPDLEGLAERLSPAAIEVLLSAHSDPYAGTWAGNNPVAMDELWLAGLLEQEPEDGGGTWGLVAPVNKHGCKLIRHLQTKDNTDGK